MLRKILFIAFSSCAIYYVFFFDSIADSVKMLVKITPMLLLIALALYAPTSRYKWVLVTGLVFCMTGDYTLQWFIIGLTSFLIGHLFYIGAFRSISTAHAPKLAARLLLLYGLAMMLWFSWTLLARGDIILTLAVCAYIAVIVTMGQQAFRAKEPFIITGALLFIVSDSILAVNRFITVLPFAHELIMLTYYSAQFFLMLSIYKQSRKVVQ